MKTIGQLKDEIRRQIWPSGAAENLTGPQPDGSMGGHDLIFQEAFAEISKWVVCEQNANVDVIEFCKTFFKCGMTIVSDPHGMVKHVFTIVGKDFCDPVEYHEVDWPEPETFARTLLPFAGQLVSAPTKFALGFSAADAGNDSKCGRARAGVWCKYRGNIYIAPWIQSVENVVIVWDGLKTQWGDDDPANEDQDYKKAIKLYLSYGHERDYGDPMRAQSLHNIAKTGTFDEALGDLMWQCDQRRKVRETPGGLRDISWINPKLIELGLPVPAAGPLVFAHIGDIGSGDANEAAVSALVHLMAPSNILLSGPNAAAQDYDGKVGQFYHDFIAPYVGAFGLPAAAGNLLWPCPGNTDWADGLAAYLSFFPTPNNRRYYDLCLWPVHFFFLDTPSAEPDGATEVSVQGQWLRAKLLLSTAPWKVVVMYGSAYSSTSGPTYSSMLGLDTLKWPFKSWGANLVLSGAKNYERLLVNGLPYINNGCGGISSTASNNAPDPNSKFFTQAFGAGRLTASKTSLLYEFLNTANVVLDSLTLNK